MAHVQQKDAKAKAGAVEKSRGVLRKRDEELTKKFGGDKTSTDSKPKPKEN